MTNYEAITEQHRLDYGRKVATYGRILADMLYSDRSHFIFELLQNAEDAGATRISFALFPDRLEVRHDGRPFNEEDVRAICSIGEGTKADDLTKIGKFGIGFKSVYAHTTSPCIHSDGEHFVIVDFVFPVACAPIEINGETLITIPFNRSASDAHTSYEHIAARLPTLSSQTLLFLSSVQEIQWQIDNKQSGHYLRDTKQTELSGVRWVDILDEQMNVENWLVFSAPVEYENYGLRVEIAFAVEPNSRTGQLQVKRVNNSKLVVFFPTEKFTRFGFVMQGTYRTTPARDNIIQDHPLNRVLIAGTADLIPRVMETLRQLGLLDANALDAWMVETLPPEKWEFQLIYDVIIRTFRTRSFLPTTSGSFVNGASAKLARGQELIALFPQSQLGAIFPGAPDVAWLHESITRDRFLRLHTFLREQVKVEEITPEKLVDLPKLPLFLRMQTDAWMIRFYTYLIGQRALWQYDHSTLRKIAFIRLETGEHVIPFKANAEPNAYLPPEDHETAFPIVRKQIAADDESRGFLRQLGLREPDLTAEVLDLILPKYERDLIDIESEDYVHDLEIVAEALIQANEKQRQGLRQRLSRATMVLAQNAISSELFYVTPEMPIAKGGEYDFLYFDNPEALYVHELVPDSVLATFKRHGLVHPGPIRARSANWSGWVSVTSMYGWHVRGLERFDPDCEIEGLANALQHISVERAILIWNKLLHPNKHHIRGIVETSSRQTFEGSRKDPHISPMGQLVRETAWLPDRDGQFHLPSELMMEELPDEFLRDDSLASQLGMRPSAIKLLAEQAGVPMELLKGWAQLSDLDRKNLLELISNARNNSQPPSRSPDATPPSTDASESDPAEQLITSPSLIDYEDELSATFDRPGHDSISNIPDEPTPVGNPQRRIDRAKEQINQAHEEEQNSHLPTSANGVNQRQNQREPDISIPLLTYPDIVSAPVVSMSRWQGKDPQTRMFLLQQYGGRCQICGETFPRRRDGQAYFEGIYMVQRSKGRWIDRPGNVLCLCANHAAQFLHGSVKGETLIEEVLAVSFGAPDYQLNFILCGKAVQVRFTERHLIDLKALLEFSRQHLE